MLREECKNIKIVETLDDLNKEIKKDLSYDLCDISDLGNEIGFALGKLIPNMTEDETQLFISGIRHGISLTNGSHK